MRTSTIVQRNQSSNVVGSSAIAMSIDEASSVFLMDALGKLYSRPAQAAMREYLSNAIDAHKAKGGDLPAIQITLPESAGSRTGKHSLLIRDFGKGMTEEEFSTILSRYGASTKRDTNTMIGGFGLGAKSGFAVSDEFFMTSYQNGKGIRVRVFKDPLNQGYIDVVDRFSTKEADGILVEVPIPSSNLPELTKKALFTEFPFFMGYGVGAIDVLPKMDLASQSVYNTKAFTPLEMGGSTVGWLGTATAPAGKMLALIGKVAYRIDMKKLHASSKDGGKDAQEAIALLSSFKREKVIDIPIGSVDLPSSREEITYSERSIRTINALLCNYALLLRQSVQKELNTKKTNAQVLKFLAELETSGYRDMDKLSWKGVTFGKDFFKDSKAYMLRFSEDRYSDVQREPLSKLAGFHRLAALSEKSDYKLGIHHVKVLDPKLVVPTSRFYTDSNICTLLGTQKAQYRTDARSALFLLIPEGDVLADWLSGGKPLAFNAMMEVVKKKQEEEKKAREQEAAKRAAAEKVRERQKKAKATRAQSMLSNFVVNNGNAQSLTCNTVETVFKDSSKFFFYWSEEEVLKHASETKVAKKLDNGTIPLFPFAKTEVANKFTVAKFGDSYYSRSSYLVKLRSFLRFFLPDGSKVIVLDKSRDLDEFRKEYPEVRSAVLAVSGEIEAQLEKPDSDILIAYNSMEKRYADKTAVHNLNQFREGVNALDRTDELAADLLAASDRFGSLLSASTIASDGKLDQNTFFMFLKGFATEENLSKNSYSMDKDVEVLAKKYPLIMHGKFPKLHKEVIAHLIDYMKMCDKNQS